MTEKEKRDAGLEYDANYDEELLKERDIAKEYCYDYNQLRPSDHESQRALLKKLLGSIGEDCTIIAPFYCDYGYNIQIGDHFFMNHQGIILDEAKVSIGTHVYIGPNCGIYTCAHPMDANMRNQGLETAKPITIGDSVWIGANVTILPGVNIGDDVVIGAGSIVNKDIPSHTVAAGNPCRILK